MKSKILIFVLTLFIISSCDEGLAPPPPVKKASISGTITYISGKDKWPPKDSVLDIRVVAFKNEPPKDILGEVTSGNAFFTGSLPSFTDTSSYFLEFIEPPLTIKYLVAAQQYGSIFDWRVIGVWTLNGDNTKPSSINIEPGKNYKNINIKVDFEHLPPQPFD